MDNQERDTSIALDYVRGETAEQLVRKYKLSLPTIRRILREQKVCRKDVDVVTQAETQKVIDDDHARIGLRLVNYRYKKSVPPAIAAELMGWSVRKLRNVEKGHSVLTLTDLKEISTYMGVETWELIKGVSNDRYNAS